MVHFEEPNALEISNKRFMVPHHKFELNIKQEGVPRKITVIEKGRRTEYQFGNVNQGNNGKKVEPDSSDGSNMNPSRIVALFVIMYLNISSIHGFNHLTRFNRHPIEIVLWLIFVVVGLYLAIVLSLDTWERYQNNPVVVTIERDYISWNTTFPPATICPYNKWDETALNEFIAKSTCPDHQLLERFLKALANGTYNNFQDIPDIGDCINPKDYLKILLEIRFKFDPGLSNSGYYPVYLDRVVTEEGICYSFNSQIGPYLTPKYWQENRWDILPEREIYSVHPIDGEVSTNIINMSTGVDLFFHGSYETITSLMQRLPCEDAHFVKIYLKLMEIYTSPEVRKLRVSQRDCRFYYEGNLAHFPVYSIQFCKIECRIRFCKKLCGCIPHFYRPLDGEVICDVKGLHCLAKNSGFIKSMVNTTNDPKKNISLCVCEPNCDQQSIYISDYDSQPWFLGSNIQWGLKDFPVYRLKRDVIFGFTDFLVYVGGMAGLFLGCSVLSFAEIIYFFTVRLFCYIRYSEWKTKNK